MKTPVRPPRPSPLPRPPRPPGPRPPGPRPPFPPRPPVVLEFLCPW